MGSKMRLMRARESLEMVTAAGAYDAILASGLGASLELAREGRLEIRQDRAFGPLFVRSGAPLALVSKDER